MSLKIGIDVDGVIADFYTGYETLTIETAGIDLFGARRYPLEEPPTWNWPEFYGYTAETMREVWNRIKNSRDFWYRLGALADVEAARRLFQTGADVYFITARPGLKAKRQTEAWLALYGMPGATVLLSERKMLCCRALDLDVYIDDKSENIENIDAVTPDTYGYLISRRYNAYAEVRYRVGGIDAAIAHYTVASCGGLKTAAA